MVATNDGCESRAASVAGEKDDGGDAGMVRCSTSLGVRKQAAKFKQLPRATSLKLTGCVSPCAGASNGEQSVASSQADRLSERLGTLMIRRVSHSGHSLSCKELIGAKGKTEMTGKEKRLALEKRRQSLRLRRAKSPPPALCWDPVAQSSESDQGEQAHCALNDGGAWEAYAPTTSPVAECPEMPPAPRGRSTPSDGFCLLLIPGFMGGGAGPLSEAQGPLGPLGSSSSQHRRTPELEETRRPLW
ncbi:hypothetical protein T484DRAFT_1967234 [Baffinella frigidus]|nr:hypothetical protein T484DRAFT_1967234 [Cryptophyta sp. CCMP2293]